MTLPGTSWREQAACRGLDPNIWHPQGRKAKGSVRYKAGAWRLEVKMTESGQRLRRVNRTVHAPDTEEGRRHAEAELAKLVDSLGVASANQAKAICAGCSVREQCLVAGLHEPAGIWGGLTETERRVEARRRLTPDGPLCACGCGELVTSTDNTGGRPRIYAGTTDGARAVHKKRRERARLAVSA